VQLVVEALDHVRDPAEARLAHHELHARPLLERAREDHPGEGLVELHRHHRDERGRAPGAELHLDAVRAAREVHMDRETALLSSVPERSPLVLEERHAAADGIADDRALPSFAQRSSSFFATIGS
jgi:hypothetical protein